MGGDGSGPGPGRPKTAGALRLAVITLRRAGLFAVAAQGALPVAWQRHGEPAGGITVVYDPARPDHLLLRYDVHRAGQAARTVRARIDLERVPQPLGGERVWFVCPGCAGRRGVLYGRGGAFRCRSCQGLVYRSTVEERPARLRRRADRELGRLEPGVRMHDVFVWGHEPAKPAGMHWKTYERRYRAARAAFLAWEREELAAVGPWLDRLEAELAANPEPCPVGDD